MCGESGVGDAEWERSGYGYADGADECGGDVCAARLFIRRREGGGSVAQRRGAAGWTLARRRRRGWWFAQLGMALVLLAAGAVTGCGGSNGGKNKTPPGAYTLTVTGTSGSTTETASLQPDGAVGGYGFNLP